MAMHHPRLVNKQFNSPINLYSADNIRDILDKEQQILYNGAVGIDFHQLAKPANLKNSAVLRMLEEEESRQRNGQPPSLKQVVWPPPQDESEYITNGDNLVHPTQTEQQYSPQSPHTLVSPQQAHSPQPVQYQQSHQQQQPKGWAPVHSPQPQVQHQQPQYSPVHTLQARRPTPPPPTTIQLRESPPISQAPAPVFPSQPATASLRGYLGSHPREMYGNRNSMGRFIWPPRDNSQYNWQPASGINMRGDQKWPPENVKKQAEEENEKRRLLAKGPVFRPRRVNKDYSGFFAQHALNSTYPGYKAPPGTQHYTEDNRGVSQY